MKISDCEREEEIQKRGGRNRARPYRGKGEGKEEVKEGN